MHYIPIFLLYNFVFFFTKKLSKMWDMDKISEYYYTIDITPAHFIHTLSFIRIHISASMHSLPFVYAFHSSVMLFPNTLYFL